MNSENNINNLENVSTNANNSKSEKKIKIALYHKHFTASLISILDMLNAKSQEIDIDSLDLTNDKNIRLMNNHTKLRTVCDNLKNGFLD